jgi:predicted CXXCH cytochrome family protein
MKCKQQLWPSILLAAIAVSFLIVGCASGTKRKWLTVFFDGVPAEGSRTNAPARAETNAPVSPHAASGFVRPEQWVEPVIFRHKPFLNEDCSQCHESKFSQRMKGPATQVCFACHTNFLQNATVKHTPAESGECMSCHHPHQSPHKGLLLMTGKAACFECHDDFLERAKVKHAPAESGECLACHAPHASPHKGLLRLAGQALCFECHDDFTEKARFKHTAVTECSECHKSHHSDEPGLLTMSAGKLCLECHEEKDLSKPAHAQMAKKSCLDCHQHHVGEDKYLLKAAARTVPTAKSSPASAHETTAR